MSGPYEYRNEPMRTAVTPQQPPAPPSPSPTPTYTPGTPYAGRQRVDARPATMPFGFRTRQFVWISIAVVNLILALRFAFIALNANDVGFVAAMYRAGAALAYPFRGILANSIRGGHILEWMDVIAIAVYTVAAWIVARLVLIATVRSDRSAPAF